jgi:inosine triphosphate pyrophosphatase
MVFSPQPPLFLTGNQHKLLEFQQVWPALQSWDIDLPEIQHHDARAVVRAKLLSAAQLRPGCSLMVEDTSLCLSALGGLPGPLTKWFVDPQALGIQGLAELALQRKNPQAEALTLIGLLHVSEDTADASGKHPTASLHIFEGRVAGQMVLPRGSLGFGWDPIFQPEGSSLTFAEMDMTEKARYSMRQRALERVGEFLESLST